MSSHIRLTIDLKAIADNWRSLSDRVFPAECAAVVKADAYGLGLKQVVPALWAAGCRSFFVAHLEEGLDLRDVVPAADIYVLNGITPGEERDAYAAKLTPIVNSLKELAQLKAAAPQNGPVSLALHVDTGIHRLGLDEAELMTLRDKRSLLSGVTVPIVMSHLVTPETPDHPLNKRQRERFCKALEIMPAAKTSLAASSGIFLGSTYYFDMVRPGAALFGLNPTPYAATNPMATVVTLEARVLQIHEVKAGETVGYGADFMVEKPSRIATLSIGYADGIPRLLSNKGYVCAGHHKVPIVGRVSMDLMTVDVSSLDPGSLAPGDFVEMIGKHRQIDEIAAEAETIGYEILTGLGRRSARVYQAFDRP